MCNIVTGKFIVHSKTPGLPNFIVNCSYAFQSVSVDFAGTCTLKTFIVEIKI